MALTPHKRSLVARLAELFPSHPQAGVLAQSAIVLGLAEHEQQMLQDLTGVVGSPVDALSLVLLARLPVGSAPAPEPEPEPAVLPVQEAPATGVPLSGVSLPADGSTAEVALEAAPSESSPVSLQGTAEAVAIPPAEAQKPSA